MFTVKTFSIVDQNSSRDGFMTQEDRRDLLRWDSDTMPASMRPGDYSANENVYTIVTHDGNDKTIFDWHMRRCAFIRERMQKNAIQKNKTTYKPTTEEWTCLRCGARAKKYHTKVNNKLHNPDGPAQVKSCLRCNYEIAKWYTHGVLQNVRVRV